jgi:hypothetical protein
MRSLVPNEAAHDGDLHRIRRGDGINLRLAYLPLDRHRLVSTASQMDSFSSLAGRKAIFLLALIRMASPVAGLRPMRAAP